MNIAYLVAVLSLLALPSIALAGDAKSQGRYGPWVKHISEVIAQSEPMSTDQPGTGYLFVSGEKPKRLSRGDVQQQLWNSPVMKAASVLDAPLVDADEVNDKLVMSTPRTPN